MWIETDLDNNLTDFVTDSPGVEAGCGLKRNLQKGAGTARCAGDAGSAGVGGLGQVAVGFPSIHQKRDRQVRQGFTQA